MFQNPIGSWTPALAIDERGMIQCPPDLLIESRIDNQARVKAVPEGLLIEKEDLDGA